MNPVIIYFIIMIMLIIVGLAIYIVSAYLSKKRLEEVVTKLGLVQGAHYDVTLLNGKKQLNLTYNRVAYGNKSKNGNINIYFTKNGNQVMIKYGNISCVSRVNAAPVTITGRQQIQTEPSKTNHFISKSNSQNAYSDKITKVQAYVSEHYKTMSAQQINDKACEIQSYPRPTPYCVVHLHYGLISLIELIYKLRDIDSSALDYCLKVCDMDIALYGEVRNVLKNEVHDDRIYVGSLTRKIIILEKRGEYQQAIEACDFGIANGYQDTSSQSFQARKERLLKKMSKTPTIIKDTVTAPKD